MPVVSKLKTHTSYPGHVSVGTKLGDIVPNFTTETTHGNIEFHNWIQDRCVYVAFTFISLRKAFKN